MPVIVLTPLVLTAGLVLIVLFAFIIALLREVLREILTFLWRRWTKAGIISSKIDKLRKLHALARLTEEIRANHPDYVLSPDTVEHLRCFNMEHLRLVPFSSISRPKY